MALPPLPYPVDVAPRAVDAEALPEGGDVVSFDTPAAFEINRARLEHLAWMSLPLDGRRVLDVGGWAGHLAQFFVERGCDVVSTDARSENVARMRELYSHLDARRVDVESDAVATVGRFEIVFCYGLLYHLENPIRALRNLADACHELLLIETMVCDRSLPVLRVEDETLSYNQALRGLGSRPSPSYVALVLSRIGFAYVYAPTRPPLYPDYEFEWLDNLDVSRDGHPLRCVFVASRTRLGNDRLVDLVSRAQ